MFERKKPPEENRWNEHICDRIREARLERGWTQQELAKRVHKSQKNISDIESARTEISAVDLVFIAHELEKSFTFFLPNFIPTEGDLYPDEWELIHFFRQIRNKGMERLLIKQAQQFAEAAIEADKQAHRQAIAEERLKEKDPKEEARRKALAEERKRSLTKK